MTSKVLCLIIHLNTRITVSNLFYRGSINYCQMLTETHLRSGGQLEAIEHNYLKKAAFWDVDLV